MPFGLPGQTYHHVIPALFNLRPDLFLAILQIDRLFRKNLNAMMNALFLLSIAVFLYLVYVLIKPEKF